MENEDLEHGQLNETVESFTSSSDNTRSDQSLTPPAKKKLFAPSTRSPKQTVCLVPDTDSEPTQEPQIPSRKNHHSHLSKMQATSSKAKSSVSEKNSNSPVSGGDLDESLISLASTSASNVVMHYDEKEYSNKVEKTHDEGVTLVFDCYFEGETLYFVEDKNNKNITHDKLPKIDKDKISSKVNILRKEKSLKRAHDQVDLTTKQEKKKSKRKRVRVSYPQNNPMKNVKYAAAEHYPPYPLKKKKDCDIIVLSDDEAEPVVELLSSDDELSDYSSFYSLSQQQTASARNSSPANLSAANSSSTSTNSTSVFPQHPSERNKNQRKEIDENSCNRKNPLIDNENEHDKSEDKGHSDELIGPTVDQNNTCDPLSALIAVMDNEKTTEESCQHSHEHSEVVVSNTSPNESSNEPLNALLQLYDKDTSAIEKEDTPEKVVVQQAIKDVHPSTENNILNPDENITSINKNSDQLINNEKSNTLESETHSNKNILNIDLITDIKAINVSNSQNKDETADRLSQTDEINNKELGGNKNSKTENNSQMRILCADKTASKDDAIKKDTKKIIELKDNSDDVIHNISSKKETDITYKNKEKKKKTSNHMFMSTGSFLNAAMLSEKSGSTFEKDNNKNEKFKSVERKDLQNSEFQNSIKGTTDLQPDSTTEINIKKLDQDCTDIDSTKIKEALKDAVIIQDEKSVVNKVCSKSFGEVDSSTDLIQQDQNIEMKSSAEDTAVKMAFNNLERPVCVAGSISEFKTSNENYLRGCRWSPDGEMILTNSNDNMLRIYKLPDDIQHNVIYQEMSPFLRMREGETVYAVDWYPYMNINDPDFCCFLSTSRDHPVHLWDSMKGMVRCTYKAYDQMDELTSANSVAFNLDGSQIYCGFNKMIRIFDSSRPGRECREISTVSSKDRSKRGRSKKPQFQQTGIISSIAFSAQYNGLYALGSYNKTVGLYNSNTDEPICLMTGHKGGVTQVKFTYDGFYLFSGGRKDPEIICWDLRDTSIPLFKMSRNVSTNQTIQFDVDVLGSHVISGDTQNHVNVWSLDEIFPMIGEDVVNYKPKYQFNAHHDVVNAASIHPKLPLLASSSGQRHFILEDSDSDETGNVPIKNKVSIDNCLKLWKL